MAEKVLSLEGRDTYERTDNYNVYGLFCYFALKMRRAFFQWIGSGVLNDDIEVSGEFNIPWTHAYTYELLMPLVVICMRSKSETIKALAFEMSHIMTFLLRDEKKKFNNLCVFITDEAIPTQLHQQFFV